MSQRPERGPESPAVVMRAITKRYPAVLANDSVDFELRRGEVHALVGENGAGKTTLMRILFGLTAPDSGVMFVDGSEQAIRSPQRAIDLGIGMVHQHFMLVPSLTVAENLSLGMEPRRGPLYDYRSAVELARSLSARYGLAVEAEAQIRDISVGERQRVEILKALARRAHILILDEPTAVLTPQETVELFGVLRGLVAEGLSVVLITHKLQEVMAVADRVTVMRAGRRIGTVEAASTSTTELARMMVGREVLTIVDKGAARPGRRVLSASGLQVLDDRGYPAVDSVAFDVRAGEIYGIAGVEGNGQSELIESLTGLRRTAAGWVELNGQEITHATSRRRRELGVAHIPEDRLALGTCATASVAENVIMGVHYRPPISRRGWLSHRRVQERAQELIHRFDVRGAAPDTPVGSLSGGNMQKVVAAREMSLQPRLLVAAQPTRGVDVGAIEFIHAQIVKYRDAGGAVLLLSAELGEVMSLADRIGVMYRGRIVREFDPDRVTENELGLYMLGAASEQGSDRL